MRVRIFAFACGAAIVVAGVLLLRSHSADFAAGTPELFSLLKRAQTEEILDNGGQTNDADNYGARQLRIIQSDSTEVAYHHPGYGFSFRAGAGFTVTSFEEDGGELILAQALDRGGLEGFQIYIIPFDEAEMITPERILKDVPDLVIRSPQEALIGPDKNIRALIFVSENTSIGDVREVWFTENGFLYQISSPVSFEQELIKLTSTLTFDQ